ncbi:MAG: PilN domain-containing protein [Deltaproteobacteria bacterium]
MMRYLKNFNQIYALFAKAGRLIRKGLSFSLADPVFSSARVVSIALDADGVYLVYAEKKLWRMNVRCFQYYPLLENQALSPEHVAQSVSAFVKDNKISRATFLLGLPRSWAIVQNVDFPSAAKEDLSRVVSFELDRLTPLSSDTACYDYSVLGEDAQNIKVLLAVARADQINAYLNALEAKSIQVNKVSLSVFMISRLIQNTYPDASMVFLSIKDGAYEGGVIANAFTAPLFAGNVNVRDRIDVDAMTGQVHALLNDLAESSGPPRLVVNADEYGYGLLRDQFRTFNVSHLNKDLKIAAPGRNGELSVVAWGGALDMLGGKTHSINLLAKHNHHGPGTPWLLSAVLLIAIMAIGAFHFLAPVHFQQQKNDELDRRIQILKPDIRKIEALQNQAEVLQSEIKAIDDFKKQNDLTISIIKDMTTILPPKTWLTRLRITDAIVEIEGYSASATEIILKLENSKYFQKVEFTSPTFRDPRLNTERFVIKMELKNAANKKELNSGVNHEKKK